MDATVFLMHNVAPLRNYATLYSLPVSNANRKIYFESQHYNESYLYFWVLHLGAINVIHTDCRSYTGDFRWIQLF